MGRWANCWKPCSRLRSPIERQDACYSDRVRPMTTIAMMTMITTPSRGEVIVQRIQ